MPPAATTARPTHCWGHRISGSEAKLADIWVYAHSPHYSEAERVALDFALAAASVPNAVTDELFARLRSHWSEGQIVEILGVVAMFGFLNRWNDSMATPLEAVPRAVADKAVGAQGWTPGHHA